jgi:hypothetical protein
MNIHDNNGADVDKMVDAYIECALWSSTNFTSEDDDGTPFDDGYGPDDIAPETVAAFYEDCEAFATANADDLATMSPEQAGHDFWLTQNRHGAGFWDRGLGAVGDRLTAAAHAYGSVDLYVGDDGKVYAS